MRPVTLDDLDLSSESEASPVSSPTLATATMKSHPSLAAQNVVSVMPQIRLKLNMADGPQDPNNVPADPPASLPISAKAMKTGHSHFASRNVVSVTARTLQDLSPSKDSQDADRVPADHINDSRNDGSASPIHQRVGYGGYHPLWRPLPYGGVVPGRQHNLQDDANSSGSTAPTDTQDSHHQTSADEDAVSPARYNGPARTRVLRDSTKKHARPGAMEFLDSWPPAKTSKSMVRTTLPQQFPHLRMLNVSVLLSVQAREELHRAPGHAIQRERKGKQVLATGYLQSWQIPLMKRYRRRTHLEKPDYPQPHLRNAALKRLMIYPTQLKSKDCGGASGNWKKMPKKPPEEEQTHYWH